MSEVKNVDQIIKAPGNLKSGDIYNGKVINLAVDKEYRTPIDTLMLLLKSTRFQALLGYLIAGILIYLIPELASAKVFINNFSIVVIAFIVGRSVEDAIGVWKSNKDTLPVDQNKNIEEMAGIFWDLFNQKLLNDNPPTPVEEPPVDTPPQ